MVVRRNDAVTLADVDEIDPDGIFAGLPEHSFTHQSLLSAETDPFRPDSRFEFSRTYSHQYEDEERVVMAVRHDSEPHVGVQFHPESILTGEGKQLIANFLERDAAVTPDPAPDGGAD